MTKIIGLTGGIGSGKTTVAKQFDINWLCRYPRPTEVGYDNGKEFIGEGFQELLLSYNITAKPTTVKNPTAQAL